MNRCGGVSDFFLTYGWAVLVILAFLGALFYFGLVPSPVHSRDGVGITNWCRNNSMEPYYRGFWLSPNQCTKQVMFCETFENNYTSCESFWEIYNLSVIDERVRG